MHLVTDPSPRTPLMDFIPMCPVPLAFPTRAPFHLKEFVEVLERAPRGGMRVLCSVPIRHHKTSTVMCAIVKWLKDDPTLSIGYMAYGLQRAKDVAKEIRDMARNMGLQAVKGHDEIVNWRTEEGGGVKAFSADQSILGSSIDVLIVDDPYEGQSQADDPRVRELVTKTIDFYTNRLMPKGSCIIVMSRFHPEDAIGERSRRKAVPWLYIHNRAIQEDGTAYAHEVFTLEELLAKKAEAAEEDPTERTWYNQWQNEPRAPGAEYFNDPAKYPLDPPHWAGYRDYMGIDMAFTTGRTADWFAIVVARQCMGKYYIRNAHRFKADPREVPSIIKASFATYGRMPIYSYMSGPERGTIGRLADQGIQIQAMQPKVNKLWRAQRAIALWRSGNILVPQFGAWVEGFVGRAKLFRGAETDDDDEVDALVSLIDATFGQSGGFGPIGVQPRRMA